MNVWSLIKQDRHNAVNLKSRTAPPMVKKGDFQMLEGLLHHLLCFLIFAQTFLLQNIKLEPKTTKLHSEFLDFNSICHNNNVNEMV